MIIKQWIFTFFVLFFSFLLEVSFFSVYFDVSIPFSLMSLVFISSKYGELIGEISGFLLGLFLDVVSGTPLGFYAISYLSVGYFLGLLHKGELVSSWFISILLFMASDLFIFLFSAFLSVFISDPSWQISLFPRNFLLSLIVAPLYFAFLSFLDSWLISKNLKSYDEF